MDFSELYAELGRKRMSVPMLAEKIGVSKKLIYSRLKGETDFKQSEISKIAEVLELDDNKVLLIFFAKAVS